MMAQELNDLFQSARRNQKKKNSRFPGKKAEEPDLDSLVPKLSLDALLQSPSPSPAAALRSRVYEFAKETPNGQRALPAEYPDNDAKIG